MEEQPPLTIAETAIALHELFISLTSAGFTDEQAMYLVAEVIARPPEGEYFDEESL